MIARPSKYSPTPIQPNEFCRAAQLGLKCFGAIKRLESALGMKFRIGSILSVATMCGIISGGDGRVLAAGGLDKVLLDRAMARAAGLPRLNALIVAHHGKVQAERAFRGPGLTIPVNVKSVSKSVISALIGIAIARGALKDPDQRIADLLANRLPAGADPRLRRITLDHLLSMRAGLERTSGRNYGRWVASADWVRHTLSRPFVEEPGGRMLYSTGNTHLLSAILTRSTGRSTLHLARDWLGVPLGISIPPWQRDPQGIYMGGNNMMLSPRAMLRFGELYRNGGVYKGRRILPEGWVKESWTPRTRSPFSGDAYGLGWFIADVCSHRVYYARGFGGQFIHVAPTLGLTVVITSSATTNTRVGGYRAALTALLSDDLVPAALKADGKTCGAGI
jgi:CubicO group peptidase (beta-lactamase class C family)